MAGGVRGVGLTDGAVMSYVDAGKKLGLHPTSVERAEKRALKKLKQFQHLRELLIDEPADVNWKPNEN